MTNGTNGTTGNGPLGVLFATDFYTTYEPPPDMVSLSDEEFSFHYRKLPSFKESLRNVRQILTTNPASTGYSGHAASVAARLIHDVQGSDLAHEARKPIPVAFVLHVGVYFLYFNP